MLAFLERGVGLEQVLPVMHVQHRITLVWNLRVIARWKPHEHIAVVFEELGMKRVVTAELASWRVPQVARSV